MVNHISSQFVTFRLISSHFVTFRHLSPQTVSPSPSPTPERDGVVRVATRNGQHVGVLVDDAIGKEVHVFSSAPNRRHYNVKKAQLALKVAQKGVKRPKKPN